MTVHNISQPPQRWKMWSCTWRPLEVWENFVTIRVSLFHIQTSTAALTGCQRYEM